jgi:uncharacterized Tic20 family protein
MSTLIRSRNRVFQQKLYCNFTIFGYLIIIYFEYFMVLIGMVSVSTYDSRIIMIGGRGGEEGGGAQATAALCTD